MNNEWVETEEKMAEEYMAPQRSFVRLTHDEVNSLMNRSLPSYELICAVENLLARKNRG